MRPKKTRYVKCNKDYRCFKPECKKGGKIKEIIVTLDEFEAVRLADLEGLYQERAAEKMNVSRQTFGRIIETAHKKVAEALVQGKALRIEGGEFEMASMREFRCHDCQHSWDLPYGTGRPGNCPSCKSGNIHRAQEDRGYARGFGRGQSRCCRGNQQGQQGENNKNM